MRSYIKLWLCWVVVLLLFFPWLVDFRSRILSLLGCWACAFMYVPLSRLLLSVHYSFVHSICIIMLYLLDRYLCDVFSLFKCCIYLFYLWSSVSLCLLVLILHFYTLQIIVQVRASFGIQILGWALDVRVVDQKVVPCSWEKKNPCKLRSVLCY